MSTDYKGQIALVTGAVDNRQGGSEALLEIGIAAQEVTLRSGECRQPIDTQGEVGVEGAHGMLRASANRDSPKIGQP